MPKPHTEYTDIQYADNLWNHIEFIEDYRREKGRDTLNLPSFSMFGHHCTRCGCPVGPESNWTCIPCHGMVEVACNVRISRDRNDGFRTCRLHDGPLYEEDQWWKRKEQDE